ncbi:DUF6705 family protein [Chryseobacterium sp.]|uniref:DUF6705 family protein n=1 Tax=Chryseobacterium sp. TaxID=1871047 RepID=UPI0028A1AB2E|nr:DUF6705 family protein [Chryseobacterium sp.]
MKNIIYLIFALFMVNINAQNTLPQSGDNILDPNADKFMGTWKWQNGNNSLTIIMKKENVLVPFPENVHADWVIGFHKFVNNGAVIEDSTMFSNANYNDKKNSIVAGSKNGFPNILHGGIYHKSKNKFVEFEIEYIDATHIKLLSLKNRPGLKVSAPGQPPFDWSITLPQNIILTKQ